MTTIILKWVLVVLASINYVYMTFDGLRGLIVGDYLRPTSGDHAGQLGPWSKLVSSVGINPESTLMKIIFVLLGLVGLSLIIGYISSQNWAFQGLLVISLCSIWYLVPGTIISIIQIAIILYLKYR